MTVHNKISSEVDCTGFSLCGLNCLLLYLNRVPNIGKAIFIWWNIYIYGMIYVWLIFLLFLWSRPALHTAPPIPAFGIEDNVLLPGSVPLGGGSPYPGAPGPHLEPLYPDGYNPVNPEGSFHGPNPDTWNSPPHMDMDTNCNPLSGVIGMPPPAQIPLGPHPDDRLKCEPFSPSPVGNKPTGTYYPECSEQIHMLQI